MRLIASIVVLLTLLVNYGLAGDLRHFEDAPLHAVQFVDDLEGWAVGDEGVIWHTINGGKDWERQPTGVRASLKSLHFLNPLVGWVVGREELPLGSGSTGVILLTTNGGENWRRLAPNVMPGLNQVRFLTDKIGYMVGDSNDQYPTGIFTTKDGGRTWKPVKGPRSTSWHAFEMTADNRGALVGAWNEMATMREDHLKLAKVDKLGGRSLNGVYLTGGLGHRRKPSKDGHGVAIGQGGLLLVSQDFGATWGALSPRLPATTLSCWDFQTVHGHGSHIWVAGRPGSVLLHSADRGKTWEMQKTDSILPLNGLYFLNEKQGWAVGELGSILATTDGGKTWKVQHRGGRRSAALMIQVDQHHFSAGALAKLGAEEGYLTTVLQATSVDPFTASQQRAGEPFRLTRAVRMAGGAAGETLWQFPRPAHYTGKSQEELSQVWDNLHRRLGSGSEQMVRQLVLAFRIWRPNVVILSSAGHGSSLTKMVAEATRAAFKKSGDASQYPDQIRQLGLTAWKPSRLYSRDDKEGEVKVSLTQAVPQLGTTIQDFVTEPSDLLSRQARIVPAQEKFALVASHLEGAASPRDLMDGIRLAHGGEARRKRSKAKMLTEQQKKLIRAQAIVKNMAFTARREGLTNPDRLLGNIAPVLEQLSPDRGARTAHAIARHFVRIGEWHLAREAFALMVDQYPAHPLAVDAYRWLIRHNASAEVRRRHELGQFVVTSAFGFRQLQPGALPVGAKELPEGAKQIKKAVDQRKTKKEVSVERWIKNSNPREVKEWILESTKLEPKLFGFGPLIARDPSIQFVLNAARRKGGSFDIADKWNERFVQEQPSGPWRDAAEMELWLSRRKGQPPKPVFQCQKLSSRPFLDGKLNDACWQGLKTVTLKNAIGKTATAQETKALVAYDKDFLYLAVRCERPREQQAALVKKRNRDMDLDDHDRIRLVLDLDRDYSTAYHLEVDQRGCAREQCWGDPRWNPAWFVAVHQEADAWQLEAAIPRVALTGDHFMEGRPWCCNITRIIPGKGAQAWSLPTGISSRDLRLEGMGLLMFMPRRTSPTVNGQGPRMKRIP